MVHFPVNPFPNTPILDRPKFEKLQTTTEMWLFKDFKIQIAYETLSKKGFKIQIAYETLSKKVKFLISSSFTFFNNVFLKLRTSMC